jgi:hypothetical protein
MPRFLEQHKTRQRLEVTQQRLQDLASWIFLEIEDSQASSQPLQSNWREVLKCYEGIPKMEARDVPIENAPNIRVTVGAIAADTIYAQAVDLIFGTTPLVTARPKPNFADDQRTIDAAKAAQRFTNHLASAEDVNCRNATEDTVLDNVQLGTGLFYVPWVERTKKTKTAKVLSSGPRIKSVAPEDIVVPGGTQQTIDEMPLFGITFYPTQQELADLARVNKWDLTHFAPVATTGWVRSRREMLARHTQGVQRKGQIYDIYFLFCYFDIDNDGYDEDLFVVYNHTGRAIGYYNFNSMDRRPAVKMVYQRRAHMFHGMGVLEMMQPFEDKLTDVHNYSTLNILLANSRVWAGDGSVPEDLRIWPGRVITGLADKDSLQSMAMADVYNSIWQDQLMTMQLANQRVGINEAVSPTQIPGRTPGMTTMSLLQQVNRRFTPAFDSMRSAIAGALIQCLYRYQEQLLAGNQNAAKGIFEVLGYQDGGLLIDLLRQPSFDEQVDLELTAASASTNREADRQNAIILTNLLAQYYQRTLELISISANPQTPPEVREVATKIARAAGEIIDRTIRTFDQVRDPATFVIEVDREMTRLESTAGSPQMALMQLFQALAGSQPQGGPAQPSQAALPERTMV